MAEPIRLLLAEDQVMVRQALATLLSLEPDLEVVVEVGTGGEVLAAVDSHSVQVALLDIEMPGGDGLSAAASLKEAHPQVKVVILTTFGRPGFLRKAMEAGASGFLLKDSPAKDLSDAVRRVVAGEKVVDPVLAAAALSDGASPLTRREVEILEAARDHPTVSEIAGVVFLSKGTVRNHLSVVIQKLGAANRADAIRIATDKGWIAGR